MQGAGISSVPNNSASRYGFTSPSLLFSTATTSEVKALYSNGIPQQEIPGDFDGTSSVII